MSDPSSILIGFFELPAWAQPTLLIMGAGLILLGALLKSVLGSRRRALLKLKKITADLAQATDKVADLETKLMSEMRWRTAEERYFSGQDNRELPTITPE